MDDRDFRLPTVRAKLIESGETYVINESDFDPKIHEKLDPEPASLIADKEINDAFEALSDAELEALSNPAVDLS
ncbi:MAG: hypothetical protein ACRCVX_07890 [Shewanella sp.]